MYGGWINIFFHSTTPNGSLRCSFFHVSCLRLLIFQHCIKMCGTICEVWPHSHRSLSAIFRLYNDERSPNSSVLICTSKEPCSFFTLVWIFKPIPGCETRSRRSRPLTSLLHDVFQLLWTCW